MMMMLIRMAVCMNVAMRMLMRMSVGVTMRMSVLVRMMSMVIIEMHVEFCPGNAAFLRARDVQVIAFEMELREFVFELVSIQTEIKQCTNEHVAADTAEKIKIKSAHSIFEPRFLFLTF